MVQRIVILLLALLFASGVPARELQVALGAQEKSLVPSFAGPGKAASQAGGLAGFNEALAREICRRLAAHCVFSHLTFAEILPGVESGQFDLGFGNYLRTPEREKRVAFSEPIWRSSSRLVAKPQVAQDLARRIKQEVTLDSLRGVRVAAVEETQQHVYLRRVADEQGLSIIPFKTIADSLAGLKQNRADFSLLPMLSAFAQFATEAPGSFEFVGPPVVDRGLGGTVHIAIPKQKEDLLRQVNQSIVALRADGTYQRIVRQFFPFSLD